MRLLIHVWACLVLSAFSPAFANGINLEGEKETKAKTTTKTDAKKLAVLESIPNRSLNVKVADNGANLDVNLSGAHENLEWTIFQPKGEIISRVKADNKINKIKIAGLERGKYVLMIRDNSGRTLFKAFDKV